MAHRAPRAVEQQLLITTTTMHSPPNLAVGCAVPHLPFPCTLHSPRSACWPPLWMRMRATPGATAGDPDLVVAFHQVSGQDQPSCLLQCTAASPLQQQPPSRRLQIAVLLGMCTVMQTVLVVPTFILLLLTGATEQLAFCFCSSSGPIKLLGSITGPCRRASPGQGVYPPALPLGCLQSKHRVVRCGRLGRSEGA